MADKKLAKTSKQNPPSQSTLKQESGLNRPKYSVMIEAALTDLDHADGSSAEDILNYICATYKISDKLTANRQLKRFLKIGVKNGNIMLLKGSGTNESFKLPDRTTQSMKYKTLKSTIIKQSLQSKHIVAKKIAPARKNDSREINKSIKEKRSKNKAANKATKTQTKAVNIKTTFSNQKKTKEKIPSTQ